MILAAIKKPHLKLGGAAEVRLRASFFTNAKSSASIEAELCLYQGY